jgi:hypothetical protein
MCGRRWRRCGTSRLGWQCGYGMLRVACGRRPHLPNAARWAPSSPARAGEEIFGCFGCVAEAGGERQVGIVLGVSAGLHRKGSQ